MSEFLLCFIPLFIAVDAIGILPLFIGLTEGIDAPRRRVVVVQSVVTALVGGLLFLLCGKWVLGALGISIADFMIAGGILIFALALNDIIFYEKRQRHVDAESLGAVPIGIPLIVGPAVLATGLLMINQFGLPMTALSLLLNVLFAGIVFWFSGGISRVLGKTGSRVVSKLASLLLAAFAVMMVRKGITQFLG